MTRVGTLRGNTGNERVSASTPATSILAKAGVAFTVHPYPHNPAAPSYGLEAAQELGVETSRVFKTLLTDADGAPVVAVVPVVGSLDLKALASAVGAKKAVMAASATAERVTGYVVGGISPLGHRHRLPIVVDQSALDFETVYVSAGKRGLDIELTPQDLIRLTTARTARIAKPG